MRVSDVTEEEVMNESTGGHHNSSAYILIYVEKSMLSQVITFSFFLSFNLLLFC